MRVHFFLVSKEPDRGSEQAEPYDRRRGRCAEGFHELFEEAKLLQTGSKEFWRLKAKLFDLLWQKLEPVMSQVLEEEQLAGAKSELAQYLQEDGLVGVFPVQGLGR